MTAPTGAEGAWTKPNVASARVIERATVNDVTVATSLRHPSTCKSSARTKRRWSIPPTGSQHLADAHVIAAAIDLGGGLALTTDPKDLGRLAAVYRNVMVVAFP